MKRNNGFIPYDFSYVIFCDRCSGSLKNGVYDSWFNKQRICFGCTKEEDIYRNKFIELGYLSNFEGKNYDFKLIKQMAENFVKID